MRKTNLLLIIALIFLTLSCKKDDETTKKDLLSGKNWVVTALTITPGINIGGGVVISDLYAQTDDCTNDDISNFAASGNYTFEEGPTKCDVNDPQVSDTGTWTFNSDETILVITSSSGYVVNFKIQELTASKLIVTNEETFDDGIKYKLTTTLQVK